jgi:hypothetical protein
MAPRSIPIGISLAMHVDDFAEEVLSSRLLGGLARH